MVALESTIFTHELPGPRNPHVAMDVERRLREADVVPATIGVLDGVVTVGLPTAGIEHLAKDDAAVRVFLPVARRWCGMLGVLGDLVEDIVVRIEEPVWEATDTEVSMHRTRGGSAADVTAFAGPRHPTRFFGCVGADPRR